MVMTSLELSLMHDLAANAAPKQRHFQETKKPHRMGQPTMTAVVERAEQSQCPTKFWPVLLTLPLATAWLAGVKNHRLQNGTKFICNLDEMNWRSHKRANVCLARLAVSVIG